MNRYASLLLGLALLGCECGPAPELPSEFEPCTENLRCALGLVCIVGGGECFAVPDYYNFCARPCDPSAGLDCGRGKPSDCIQAFGPLPTNWCRPLCQTLDDCPAPFPWPYTTCALPGGQCLQPDPRYTCPAPDGGWPNSDSGP